jgi:hypothetical protein
MSEKIKTMMRKAHGQGLGTKRETQPRDKPELSWWSLVNMQRWWVASGDASQDRGC